MISKLSYTYVIMFGSNISIYHQQSLNAVSFVYRSKAYLYDFWVTGSVLEYSPPVYPNSVCSSLHTAHIIIVLPLPCHAHKYNCTVPHSPLAAVRVRKSYLLFWCCWNTLSLRDWTNAYHKAAFSFNLITTTSWTLKYFWLYSHSLRMQVN